MIVPIIIPFNPNLDPSTIEMTKLIILSKIGDFISSKNPAPDLKLSKLHLNKLTKILKHINFSVNLLKIN